MATPALKTFASAMALLLCLFFQGVHAANLVTNGDFETGDFSGWTTFQSGQSSYFGVDSAGPIDGAYSAFFAGVGPDSDAISQTFVTSIGQSYAIRFVLDSIASTGDAAFIASFDGATLFVASGTYALEPLAFTVTASSTSSTLKFSSFNDLGYFTLDDVSVIAVPEPAVYNMLALGLVVTMLLRRRTRSSA